MALNARQNAFIREYLIDFNGTQAAIRAGYARSSAAVHAHRLITNDKIRAEIDRQMEALTMSRAEVAYRLGQQAAAGYAEYLRPNKTVDLEKLLADGKGHLIKGYKETQAGTQIIFHDVQSALAILDKRYAALDAKGADDGGEASDWWDDDE